MKHITTTPYHPQANGVIKINGIVLNILHTLVQDNVGVLDTMLTIATLAYNTHHSAVWVYS